MNNNFVFSLGDKLPYEYEVAKAILTVSPSGNPSEQKEFQVRKNAVNAYTRTVRELWCKAFGGENFIKTRKCVDGRIRKILTLYYNMSESW